MKQCTRCHELKPADDFHWKIEGKRRQTRCKCCQRELAIQRYEADKPAYFARNKVRRERNRQTSKRLIEDIKRAPCMDCGNCFPGCAMQFDHVRGKKRDHVSSLASNGREWSVVEAEIAKCDLVCANCHAMRTETRRLAGEVSMQRDDTTHGRGGRRVDWRSNPHPDGSAREDSNL